MRKLFAPLVVLGLVGVTAPAVAQQYEFTLNNQSGYYLTLIVDGVRHCATPSGDRCTTLVSPGWHNFRAQASAEQYVDRRVNVDGPKTWTITPPR